MAYVQHIVEQIQSNIAFLVDNGHMSQQDAEACFARLPGSEQTIVAATGRLAITAPPAPRAIAAPPVPVVSLPRVRATYAYNQDGSDPDDLSFRPGDVIELVEETNADWWKGRFNGKEGLFPSNYVEKMAFAAPSAPLRSIHAPPPSSEQKSKSVYRPFGAAHHGADKPPPPGSGQVNSVGLSEAPGQQEKKSKFGKYGNTMAHSAAGGVGFGAGAAIGGGLVRAIF